MKKLLLLLVLFTISLSGNSIETEHFIPVWVGENGFSHMNMYVRWGTIDSEPLDVGDEVGVFDTRGICVGANKLINLIDTTNFTTFTNTLLSVILSMDDGTLNGFSDSDTILIKIWDVSEQIESDVTKVVYSDELPYWVVDGKFLSGATAFVDVAAQTKQNQILELKNGWNILSTNLNLFDNDIDNIFWGINGELIKIQNQKGYSYEYWTTYSSWINRIGLFNEIEGYKVKVSNDTELSLSGYKMIMPLTIALNTGWNTITFPYNEPKKMMDIIQSLIDNGTFVKMIDEQGKVIVSGDTLGWIDEIGDGQPNKGYHILVNSNVLLTYPKFQ